MFIILRGSANVLVRRKTIRGEEFEETVAIEYDGYHFGEYTMMKRYKEGELPDRRRATVQCAEQCDIFVISLADFQAFVLPKITKEVKGTIIMLKQIPCFKNLEEHELIPFAANFQLKTYQLGEYIIKQGLSPEFFGMVEEGDIQAVLEEEIVVKTYFTER